MLCNALLVLGLAVTSAWGTPSLKIKIKIPSSEALSLTYPQTLHEPLVLGRGVSGKLSLSVSAPVTQAVLSLSSTSGSSASWLMTPSGSSQQEFSLSLSPDMVAGLGEERVCSLSLFLSSRDADSEFHNAPVAYVLGDLKVTSLPESAPPKDNVEVVTFGLLPEIAHTFKEDQQAPNGFLATLFSLGLLGLWVPFASQSLSLGINFQNAYGSGALGLYGSAFMGLLALATGLLYAYWTVLRILPFLGYASVLGSLLVFVGHRALVAHHALRLLQTATPASKKTL